LDLLPIFIKFSKKNQIFNKILNKTPIFFQSLGFFKKKFFTSKMYSQGDSASNISSIPKAENIFFT
jgi:hypothetical protein